MSTAKSLTLRKESSLTLREALALAEEHWESKGQSSRMMSTRASTCFDLLVGAYAPKTGNLPVSDLRGEHGTCILTALQNKGLAKSTIAVYYTAFRRMVKLAGGSTAGWPAPGKAPRRVREPLKDADLTKLQHALSSGRYAWTGWEHRNRKQTADLLILLKGTGMRVEVEALSWDVDLGWNPEERTLKIAGKGGHERMIPVEDPACIELLNDLERLKAMRRLSYSGHLKRWKLATERLGITTKLPTPHAVRHWWATKVYHGSGKDLVLTQEMMGHADVATTARYIGVDMDAARKALAA